MIFRSVISIFSATVGLAGVIVARVGLRVLIVLLLHVFASSFIVASVVVFTAGGTKAHIKLFPAKLAGSCLTVTLSVPVTASKALCCKGFEGADWPQDHKP